MAKMSERSVSSKAYPRKLTTQIRKMKRRKRKRLMSQRLSLIRNPSQKQKKMTKKRKVMRVRSKLSRS